MIMMLQQEWFEDDAWLSEVEFYEVIDASEMLIGDEMEIDEL